MRQMAAHTPDIGLDMQRNYRNIFGRDALRFYHQLHAFGFIKLKCKH